MSRLARAGPSTADHARKGPSKLVVNGRPWMRGLVPRDFKGQVGEPTESLGFVRPRIRGVRRDGACGAGAASEMENGEDSRLRQWRLRMPETGIHQARWAYPGPASERVRRPDSFRRCFPATQP